MKKGSSWRIYRPVPTENSVQLECPYPEENFSDYTAVLALLFCKNATSGVYNQSLISKLSLNLPLVVWLVAFHQKVVLTVSVLCVMRRKLNLRLLTSTFMYDVNE